ncbi:hypothetical protein FACS189445_1440 [Spirochaetia bacterium]|nr:hypothetical protein FACS189445_1440 [Spirochaetia bacterium]
MGLVDDLISGEDNSSNSSSVKDILKGVVITFTIIAGTVATIIIHPKSRKWLANKLKTKETPGEVVSKEAKEKVMPKVKVSTGHVPDNFEPNKLRPEDQPRILFDTFIPQNYFSVIVANSGVGKTLLSVKLAESKYIKKVLYFAFDDTNGDQLYRYEVSPVFDDKICVLSGGELDGYLDELTISAKDGCAGKGAETGLLKIGKGLAKMADKVIPGASSLLTGFIDFPEVTSKKTKELMRELGIKTVRKLNNMFLFMAILDMPESKYFDMIVIDSLNAFAESSTKINQELIVKLKKVIRGKNQTLVVLHHENREGGIGGSIAVLQQADSLVFLKKAEGEARYEDGEIRCLKHGDEGKERYGKKKELFLEMYKTKSGYMDFEVRDDIDVSSTNTENKPSMERNKEKVMQIIGDEDTIAFTDLHKAYGGSGGALKAVLKILADEDHKIHMADGSTWEIIGRGPNPK